MYQGGVLAATLLITQVGNPIPPSTMHLSPLKRVVATVYEVKNINGAACLAAPMEQASILSTLHNGDLTDLVALEEGTVKRGDDYWLHVYPRLSHRPACYINVRSLIPYA